MELLKKLFRNKSEISHLKNMISVQKEIVKTHESTLFLLKANYTDRVLKNLIEEDLKEAKQELENYQENLKKLEN